MDSSDESVSSPDEAEVSPTKSRFGRTHKPKKSLDFCDIDEAFSSTKRTSKAVSPKKTVSMPSTSRASMPSTPQRVVYTKSPKNLNKPAVKKRPPRCDRIEVQDEFDNYLKAPKQIKPLPAQIPFISRVPKSALGARKFFKEKIVLAEEPCPDVSKVFKLITAKPKGESEYKQPHANLVKTYGNKRRVVHGDSIESFGLPDVPIVPAVKPKTQPKRIQNLDVVPNTDVSLVNADVTSFPWEEQQEDDSEDEAYQLPHINLKQLKKGLNQSLQTKRLISPNKEKLNKTVASSSSLSRIMKTKPFDNSKISAQSTPRRRLLKTIRDGSGIQPKKNKEKIKILEDIVFVAKKVVGTESANTTSSDVLDTSEASNSIDAIPGGVVIVAEQENACSPLGNLVIESEPVEGNVQITGIKIIGEDEFESTINKTDGSNEDDTPWVCEDEEEIGVAVDNNYIMVVCEDGIGVAADGTEINIVQNEYGLQVMDNQIMLSEDGDIIQAVENKNVEIVYEDADIEEQLAVDGICEKPDQILLENDNNNIQTVIEELVEAGPDDIFIEDVLTTETECVVETNAIDENMEMREFETDLLEVQSNSGEPEASSESEIIQADVLDTECFELVDEGTSTMARAIDDESISTTLLRSTPPTINDESSSILPEDEPIRNLSLTKVVLTEDDFMADDDDEEIINILSKSEDSIRSTDDFTYSSDEDSCASSKKIVTTKNDDDSSSTSPKTLATTKDYDDSPSSSFKKTETTEDDDSSSVNLNVIRNSEDSLSSNQKKSQTEEDNDSASIAPQKVDSEDSMSSNLKKMDDFDDNSNKNSTTSRNSEDSLSNKLATNEDDDSSSIIAKSAIIKVDNLLESETKAKHKVTKDLKIETKVNISPRTSRRLRIAKVSETMTDDDIDMPHVEEPIKDSVVKESGRRTKHDKPKRVLGKCGSTSSSKPSLKTSVFSDDETSAAILKSSNDVEVNNETSSPSKKLRSAKVLTNTRDIDVKTPSSTKLSTMTDLEGDKGSEAASKLVGATKTSDIEETNTIKSVSDQKSKVLRSSKSTTAVEHDDKEISTSSASTETAIGDDEDTSSLSRMLRLANSSSLITDLDDDFVVEKSRKTTESSSSKTRNTNSTKINVNETIMSPGAGKMLKSKDKMLSSPKTALTLTDLEDKKGHKNVRTTFIKKGEDRVAKRSPRQSKFTKEAAADKDRASSLAREGTFGEVKNSRSPSKRNKSTNHNIRSPRVSALTKRGELDGDKDIKRSPRRSKPTKDDNLEENNTSVLKDDSYKDASSKTLKSEKPSSVKNTFDEDSPSKSLRSVKVSTSKYAREEHISSKTRATASKYDCEEDIPSKTDVTASEEDIEAKTSRAEKVSSLEDITTQKKNPNQDDDEKNVSSKNLRKSKGVLVEDNVDVKSPSKILRSSTGPSIIIESGDEFYVSSKKLRNSKVGVSTKIETSTKTADTKDDEDKSLLEENKYSSKDDDATKFTGLLRSSRRTKGSLKSFSGEGESIIKSSKSTSDLDEHVSKKCDYTANVSIESPRSSEMATLESELEGGVSTKNIATPKEVSNEHHIKVSGRTQTSEDVARIKVSSKKDGNAENVQITTKTLRSTRMSDKISDDDLVKDIKKKKIPKTSKDDISTPELKSNNLKNNSKRLRSSKVSGTAEIDDGIEIFKSPVSSKSISNSNAKTVTKEDEQSKSSLESSRTKKSSTPKEDIKVDNLQTSGNKLKSTRALELSKNEEIGKAKVDVSESNIIFKSTTVDVDSTPTRSKTRSLKCVKLTIASTSDNKNDSPKVKPLKSDGISKSVKDDKSSKLIDTNYDNLLNTGKDKRSAKLSESTKDVETISVADSSADEENLPNTVKNLRSTLLSEPTMETRTITEEVEDNLMKTGKNLRSSKLCEPTIKTITISGEDEDNLLKTSKKLSCVKLSESIIESTVAEQIEDNLPKTGRKLRSAKLSESTLETNTISKEDEHNLSNSGKKLRSAKLSESTLETSTISKEDEDNLPNTGKKLKSVKLSEETIETSTISKEDEDNLPKPGTKLIADEGEDNLPNTGKKLKSTKISQATTDLRSSTTEDDEVLPKSGNKIRSTKILDAIKTDNLSSKGSDTSLKSSTTENDDDVEGLTPTRKAKIVKPSRVYSKRKAVEADNKKVTAVLPEGIKRLRTSRASGLNMSPISIQSSIEDDEENLSFEVKKLLGVPKSADKNMKRENNSSKNSRFKSLMVKDDEFTGAATKFMTGFELNDDGIFGDELLPTKDEKTDSSVKEGLGLEDEDITKLTTMSESSMQIASSDEESNFKKAAIRTYKNTRKHPKVIPQQNNNDDKLSKLNQLKSSCNNTYGVEIRECKVNLDGKMSAHIDELVKNETDTEDSSKLDLQKPDDVKSSRLKSKKPANKEEVKPKKPVLENSLTGKPKNIDETVDFDLFENFDSSTPVRKSSRISLKPTVGNLNKSSLSLNETDDSSSEDLPLIRMVGRFNKSADGNITDEATDKVKKIVTSPKRKSIKKSKTDTVPIINLTLDNSDENEEYAFGLALSKHMKRPSPLRTSKRFKSDSEESDEDEIVESSKIPKKKEVEPKKRKTVYESTQPKPVKSKQTKLDDYIEATKGKNSTRNKSEIFKEIISDDEEVTTRRRSKTRNKSDKFKEIISNDDEKDVTTRISSKTRNKSDRFKETKSSDGEDEKPNRKSSQAKYTPDKAILHPLGDIMDDVEIIKRAALAEIEGKVVEAPQKIEDSKSKKKESYHESDEDEVEIVPVKEAPVVASVEILDDDKPVIKEEPIDILDGDLLFARLGSYPYWPCVIMKDPAKHRIYNIIGKHTKSYHVRFFGDKGRRSWVAEKNLLPYSKKTDILHWNNIQNNQITKKPPKAPLGYIVPPKLKAVWESGLKEADDLVPKSVSERYDFFFFMFASADELKKREASKKLLEVKTEIKQEDEAKTVTAIKKPKISKALEESFTSKPKTSLRKLRSSNIHAVDDVDADVEFVEIDTDVTIKLESDSSDDDSSSKWSEQTPVHLTSEDQTELHKRNNLFKGVRREKVCQICFAPDNILKCKGRCHGFYHRSCAIQVKTEEKPSKKDVEVVSVKASKYKPSKLTLDADKRFKEMTLEEQIDFKLQEIMKPMIGKTIYADSTTDYTSSEESCGSEPSGIIKHVTADDIIIVKPAKKTKHELDNNFKCGNCSLNEIPMCFVCNSIADRKGNTSRQPCSIQRCGKFFHQACLKEWPQTQFSFASTSRQEANERSFTCPMHVCHICVSDDPRAPNSTISSHKIVRCLKCPATYHAHTHCIPAGTNIVTSTQIICPRHLKRTFSKKKAMKIINTAWCLICGEAGDLICCETCPTSLHRECSTINLTDNDTYICEDCETGRLPLYDEIVWVKLGFHRWWPAIILYPNEIPAVVARARHYDGEFVVKFFGTHDHYWVSRGRVFLFQDGDKDHEIRSSKKKVELLFGQAILEAAAVHSFKMDFKKSREDEFKLNAKPPPYVRIKCNKPVGNVKVFDANVSNTTPCSCNPNTANPCGPDSDCLNRLLMTECDAEVCPAGDKCQNQGFEKRVYPSLAPFNTNGRGWGLKALDPIRKGHFVIEYVGEVIDDQEYQRRLHKMQEQKESNYYFLTIDSNRMIDAGPKGNVARFMNHCCKPNCETQKWTVKGDTRVGLFAIEDIEANTELTFNYNLECVGESKKICHCGAPTCSGFIGVKAKSEEKEKKVRKQLGKPKKKRSGTPTASTDEVKVEPCFVCGKNDDVTYTCNNKVCLKYFHLKCVNLSVYPEGGKWSCSWHTCNICTKRTIRCCVKCLNSYCPIHSDGNIRHDKLLGFVCTQHDPNKEPQELVISSLRASSPTPTEEDDVTSTTQEDLIPPQKPDKIPATTNSRKRRKESKGKSQPKKRAKLLHEEDKSSVVQSLPASQEVILTSSVPERHLRTLRKKGEEVEPVRAQRAADKNLPIRKRATPRTEISDAGR